MSYVNVIKEIEEEYNKYQAIITNTSICATNNKNSKYQKYIECKLRLGSFKNRFKCVEEMHRCGLSFQNTRQLGSPTNNLGFDPNIHSLTIESIHQGLIKDTLHFRSLDEVNMVDHLYKPKIIKKENNHTSFHENNKDMIRKTENIQTKEIIWTRKERLSHLDFLHRNKMGIDFRLSVSTEETLKESEIKINDCQEMTIRKKSRISFLYPKENPLYSVDVTQVHTHQPANNPNPQISNEIEIECLNAAIQINFKSFFTLYIILLKQIKGKF